MSAYNLVMCYCVQCIIMLCYFGGMYSIAIVTCLFFVDSIEDSNNHVCMNDYN